MKKIRDHLHDIYTVCLWFIFEGSSQVVLRPKTTSEVSAILKYCNDRRLAVVPQGGNTGLVGGSVPIFDEVIISTRLMNNITSLDKTTGKQFDLLGSQIIYKKLISVTSNQAVTFVKTLIGIMSN